MRATILPLAIILTKACRAAVSMMAKGSTVLIPNYIQIYAIIMQKFSFFDKRRVLQQEYSETSILPSGTPPPPPLEILKITNT